MDNKDEENDERKTAKPRGTHEDNSHVSTNNWIVLNKTATLKFRWTNDDVDQIPAVDSSAELLLPRKHNTSTVPFGASNQLILIE